MVAESNLISNEKPQRLRDKIVEFIKKIFSKKSNSDKLNKTAISPVSA